MNILGVGGWEFAAILVIMLIVAGPHRMARWAYLMGKYMAKVRAMWADTMAVLQAEFDEAGLDVQLPKEPPTRASVNRAAADALKPFTKQVEDAISEVETEMKVVEETAAMVSGNGQKSLKSEVDTPAETPPAEDDNGSKPNFGTWSNSGKNEN